MGHGRIILPPIQFVAREQLGDWFEDFNDTRIWWESNMPVTYR